MKHRPRILVIGSVNTDMTVRVGRLPRPGETILGDAFVSSSGGKGANQAVAASRAGGDVTFICCVGPDTFGRQTLAGLKREGIRVRWVRGHSEAPTGVALIFVSRDGENCIAVAPGANALLSVDAVAKHEAEFSRCDLLLMQLETPLKTAVAAAKLAARFGVPVVLNPAPAPVGFPAGLLLPLVTVITPNANEAGALTGIPVRNKTHARRAALWFHERGVPNVAITLGKAGVFLSCENGHEWIPAHQVRMIDTVGAGDVFNGALAVGLAGGQTLSGAVEFAAAAAAISVTRYGAQASSPLREEILKLARIVKGSTLSMRRPQPG